MFKIVFKFILTILLFIPMIIILLFRFIVTGARNEDVYCSFINDFFKFWDIELRVVENKKKI